MKYIIVGPSRCGKTVFARRLVRGHPDAVLIDEITRTGDFQAAVEGHEHWVVVLQDLAHLTRSERGQADVVFERVKGSEFDFRTRDISPLD